MVQAPASMRLRLKVAIDPKAIKQQASKFAVKAKEIYSGPVRNSMLVGKEFVKLVAEEQQMLKPKQAQWQAAKQQFIEQWDRQSALGLNALNKSARELTWSQVASTGRRAVDIAAFYYIGVLAGQTAVYPISLIVN